MSEVGLGWGGGEGGSENEGGGAGIQAIIGGEIWPKLVGKLIAEYEFDDKGRLGGGAEGTQPKPIGGIGKGFEIFGIVGRGIGANDAGGGKEGGGEIENFVW